MPNVELKRGQEVKEDAFEIRRRVFMEEQGYTDEFDDIDDTCIHIVLYKDGEPAGCARTFPEPAGSTRWAVGRVAVLPEKREGGFGRMLVEECEHAAIEAGATEMCLHAQARLESWYGLMGYTRASAKSTTKTKANRTFGWKRLSRAPSSNTPYRNHPHSERFLGVAALAPD